jgi:hypothetical protein
VTDEEGWHGEVFADGATWLFGWVVKPCSTPDAGPRTSFLGARPSDGRRRDAVGS